MTHAANKSLQISKEGIALIRHYESWRATTYLDPIGVPTIGWGTTGKEAKIGRTITKKQGEVFFRADIAESEAEIKRVVKVALSQGQFDALVSIHYNMGLTRLLKTEIIDQVNKGDPIAAAGLFARHNKAEGKVFSGLTKRRASEAALFLQPDEAEDMSEDVKGGREVNSLVAEGSNVSPDETNDEGRSTTEIFTGSRTMQTVMATITTFLAAISQLFEPLKDNPTAMLLFGLVVVGMLFIGYLKVTDKKKGL